VKRFSCGDVIPGCHRVFAGAGDQSVLDQVLAHAAADHGLIEPPMALLELVIAHTYPFVPGRDRTHLRVVDAPPLHCTEAPGALLPASTREPDNEGHGFAETLAPVTPLAGNSTGLAGRGGAEHRPKAAPVSSDHDSYRHDSYRHDSYRHECVMYRGEQGFVQAVLPFVRDGLARDEPVLVAVIDPRLRALRAALGRDAEGVLFADMAELGHNPARIIPAWREFTARHGGRPIRGVGEPIWAGRRDAEIVECQFHEALLNVAVAAATPLWLICPYDTATLDGTILREARRSHPVVTERGSDHLSAEYGGGDVIDSMFAAALPDPLTHPTTIQFDGCRQRHIGRIQCGAQAAGLPADRAAGLAVAVNEISTTAFGVRGPVQIRLWAEPGAVICDIAGAATFDNPMIGRSAVIAPDRRERAIRLANAVCDLVQVRSRPEGGTVRLRQWLSLAAAGS